MENKCAYTVKEMKCVFDGGYIYGNIYIPENGREKHPAVILSHGYNCVGFDMKDAAERLAETGVIAYIYDFRGGSSRSESSGISEDMSIRTEQDDLSRVIDMISALNICDEEKIYLYGESQGGFVSALTGAEMPERIAGMFLVYPAFCIPEDWLGRDPDDMPKPFAFMNMKLSKTFFDGIPRYDVFEHVKKFNKPVLIFHGDKDALVKLSYSERLTECFPDASLTVLTGEGHGFSPEGRVILTDKITDYFISNDIV